jgi:NADH-quinone oxidoreductase subunit L
MLVGVLAIAGTPFFSGWYSKDAMIVSALSFVSLRPEHFFLLLLPTLTAGITAFYMFRLWFMTFAGEPRDQHVYDHAHESPWIMTGPLVVLAFFSIVVAWGWPPYDVQASYLEHLLHHEYPHQLTDLATADHPRVVAEQGNDAVLPALVAYQLDKNLYLSGLTLPRPHELAGGLALAAALIGTALAFAVYYLKLLDPEQTRESFAGVYRFLWHKWYFDEFYSAAVVRPAAIVAGWCRGLDLRVIDGIINWLGRFTVKVSSWDGKFDLGVVDGLVNLTANVVFAVGAWLRVVQTGSIRNYVLFLALAAVAIFAVLSYVVALAG